MVFRVNRRLLCRLPGKSRVIVIAIWHRTYNPYSIALLSEVHAIALISHKVIHELFRLLNFSLDPQPKIS